MMVMVDSLWKVVVSLRWTVRDQVVTVHGGDDWRVSTLWNRISLHGNCCSVGLTWSVLSLLHGGDDVFADTLLMQGNDFGDLWAGLHTALLDLVDHDLLA